MSGILPDLCNLATLLDNNLLASHLLLVLLFPFPCLPLCLLVPLLGLASRDFCLRGLGLGLGPSLAQA